MTQIRKHRWLTIILSVAVLLLVPYRSAFRAQEKPGYPIRVLEDSFNGAQRWQAWQNQTLSAQIDNGVLRLQSTGADRFGWTFVEQIGPLKDLLLRVDVRVERPATYTEFGVIFRAVQRKDGLYAYALMFNNQGQWQFGETTPDRFRVIRDWSSAGFADPNQVTQVGVLAEGNRFTLLINGEAMATTEDSAIIDAGRFGLLIGTGTGVPTTASALYDNVSVYASDRESLILIPNKIENIGRAPSLILEELTRTRLIGIATKPVFASAQSYLNNYREGLVTIRVGKQSIFENSILIASLSWDSPKFGIACGLATRYTDDDNLDLLLVDKFGGFGFAQVIDGVRVQSHYAPSNLIKTLDQQVNRLLVVSNGPMTTLYINGEWAGTLYGVVSRGGAAIVAYNYETASVRCQFDNLVIFSADP